MIMGKGLEMNIIVALILALVAVSFFLLLAGGEVKKTATSLYCRTFAKQSTDQNDPSVPEMCREEKIVESLKIESTDSRLFSRELLSYIIACWQKADTMKVKEKYTCFELSLPGGIQNVNEESVSEILSKEDHCRSIENSDYGCGVLDQISWEVEGGVISDQRILFIEYDPSRDVVSVLG